MEDPLTNTTIATHAQRLQALLDDLLMKLIECLLKKISDPDTINRASFLAVARGLLKDLGITCRYKDQLEVEQAQSRLAQYRESMVIPFAAESRAASRAVNRD